jgi:plasmid stabilization system protein ParE
MDYQVILSEQALVDLRGICSFIAPRNPEAAPRVGEGNLDHVRIHSSYPFIGPDYPRGAQDPLREIVSRPCRIFHEVSEASNRVENLPVWHGARNEPQF